MTLQLIYRLQIMKTHFLHMLTIYKQINYIHKIFRALQDRITKKNSNFPYLILFLQR